ncbi:hypothetical protein HYU11_03395 [Candidatus Woesearchaeota archaeon]|nr:hypothetical protein [Candidatus Woesearchaeota archaeon]
MRWIVGLAVLLLVAVLVYAQQADQNTGQGNQGMTYTVYDSGQQAGVQSEQPVRQAGVQVGGEKRAGCVRPEPSRFVDACATPEPSRFKDVCAEPEPSRFVDISPCEKQPGKQTLKCPGN